MFIYDLRDALQTVYCPGEPVCGSLRGVLLL